MNDDQATRAAERPQEALEASGAGSVDDQAAEALQREPGPQEGALEALDELRTCRGPGCEVEFRPRSSEHWFHSGPCRTAAWDRAHPRVGRPARQLELEDREPVRPIPAGPPDGPPAERKRLSRQCRAILTRLQEGPAAGSELVGIAQRFGARLKELRDAGQVVKIVERDRASGRVVYRLFRDEAEWETWRDRRVEEVS